MSSSGFFAKRLAVLGGDERTHAIEVIEIEVDHSMRDLRRDVELGVGLEAREVRRRHAFDGVDVAGEQCRHARRLALDDLERDLVPDRLIAPVVVVAREFHPVAVYVAHELEAAAADGRLAAVEVVRRGIRRRLLRYDVDRGQVVGCQRIGRRILQAQRVRIDDLLRDDCLGIGGEAAGAVRDQRHAIDREHDVLGGQLGSIVEFDALAQLEFPRRVVDGLPRRRDARDHLRIGVHLHELVEDMLGNVVVGKQVEEMGVDRRDVRRDRDLQFRRRCPLRGVRRHEERRTNDQDA